ncbi:hypothetical protein [Paracoccus kondratievae]|uniref:Uncharacterized protein n=1 Tax=Paracoccus kondratievae TaxID=135740 RepID=A0AAD3NXM4_9RHOB|nr:hypothetical protein [Paracoccus kondratievae]AZV00234.1 hypothetical protein pkon1_p05 [Paracoccus phage vB_PkoS_Pkon1]GLK63514.1 hypothetical protein GCM10017635_09840 [Paracoccus kondratievae]
MTDGIARVSRLPYRNGDGYSFGGEIILTIGDRAIMLGARSEEMAFAQELALAWNARRTRQGGA